MLSPPLLVLPIISTPWKEKFLPCLQARAQFIDPEENIDSEGQSMEKKMEKNGFCSLCLFLKMLIMNCERSLGSLRSCAIPAGMGQGAGPISTLPQGPSGSLVEAWAWNGSLSQAFPVARGKHDMQTIANTKNCGCLSDTRGLVRNEPSPLLDNICSTMTRVYPPERVKEGYF